MKTHGHEWGLLQNAMKVVQISQTDQESAFAMLAAVLWIGNINFSVVDTENHVTIVDKEGKLKWSSEWTLLIAYYVDVCGF